MSRVNKAWWLLHKNFFREYAMEESIFDIKLSHRPIIINGYGEDQTDSGDFHNRAKGLIKIKTGFLIKPFGDKARFIAQWSHQLLALLEKLIYSPLHSLLEKEEPTPRSDF